MSREKAMKYLGFVSEEHDPIEIKKYVGKALGQLRKSSDEDPIEFLGEVVETIQEHLGVLVANLPQYQQSSAEKVQKYTICESELITISEFAKEGLKARLKGAGRSAFDLIKAQQDHCLQEFEKEKGTGFSIQVNDGKLLEMTPEKIKAVEKVIANDPRIQALREVT